MYRATTPVHTFTLPISTSDCAVVLVTYEQGKTEINKEYNNDTLPSGMTFNDKDVVITLTQEEANMFKTGKIDVQIRVLTNSGAAYASEKFKVKSLDVLNDKILVEE